MSWLFLYADLIGGVLGIAGSLVLGYPFLTEMADRRHWDLFVKYRQHQLARSPDSLSTAEREAERELRDQMIDARLGQYAHYRTVTMVGFMLLVIAFVFMTIASFERLNHP